MKKWKGVALSPDNERKTKIDVPTPKPLAPLPPKPLAPLPPKAMAPPPPKMSPPPPPPILIENDTIQKENIDPEPTMDDTITEPTVNVYFHKSVIYIVHLIFQE